MKRPPPASDPLRASRRCDQRARYQPHNQPPAKRILMRHRRRHRNHKRPNEKQRHRSPSLPQRNHSHKRHHQKHARPSISQQSRIGKNRSQSLPKPPRRSRHPQRPRKKSARPEIIHELARRRRHGPHSRNHSRHRPHSPQWNHDQQLSRRFSVPRNQPIHRQPQSNPRHHQHSRLREPHNHQPQSSGEQKPFRRRLLLAQIQRQKQESNSRGNIHRVLLHVSAIPDQRHSNRKQKQRQSGPRSPQHPLRKPPEKNHAGHSAEKRKQSQR